MARPTLLIGNKNYSSWSLRAWLALEQTGIAFDEVRIALFKPGYQERIAQYSAAGKVPVLIDGDIHVWESLAILEYLAEKYPDKQLWPADARERAYARSISNEMHAGFTNLRSRMPMNIRGSHPGKGRTPEVLADIARIAAIWSDCRQRHAAHGPFLFGQFCNADAMYAPVAMRFITYAVELPAPARDYVDALGATPAIKKWRAAALAETEIIEEDEPYR